MLPSNVSSSPLFLATFLSHLLHQMTLQISFRYHGPPLTFILGTIIISIFLAAPAVSANPKFQACAPKSCGNGPIIKYPFWIPNEQQKLCGFPHFEIRCYHKYPILRISNQHFLVREISYSYSSFVVADIAVYEQKCPAPLYNYSLDFDQTPFKYSSDNFNISFFYNCTSKPIDYPTYEVECAENATHHSFGVFHKEALQHKHYFDECQFMVEVPVKMNASVNFTTLLRMNYTEILKTGFLVNWSAPDCQHCERSGGRCGFDDYKFLCFCKDKPHLKTCDDASFWNWKRKLIVGAAASSFSVIFMSTGFYFYLRRKKNHYAKSYIQSQSRTISSNSSVKDAERGSKYFGLHVFTYTELEEATKNFDSAKELGDGGFGTVYCGKLGDGRTVAVKRLHENNGRRLEQFMNEVGILTRLHHQNLVQLYGCTSRHSRELLLVYEYIPNGTVADHLHGPREKTDSLTWHTRMNIAIETASALTYLHASDIIHRDIKTTNILLDNHFVVKVADFGLSRLFPNDVTHVSTAPQGTPGYVDPEYHQCYQLTDKSDVYSFGVVLIELISSKPAVDITRHRHEINLANMAINKIQNGDLHELVDPTLGFEADDKVRKMINGVAELAFQCLQSMKDMRPSMQEVVERLKEIQNDGMDKTKAEEMDISADDVVLMKNEPPPPSPDSNIRSRATTPNASG